MKTETPKADTTERESQACSPSATRAGSANPVSQCPRCWRQAFEAVELRHDGWCRLCGRFEDLGYNFTDSHNGGSEPSLPHLKTNERND